MSKLLLSFCACSTLLLHADAPEEQALGEFPILEIAPIPMPVVMEEVAPEPQKVVVKKQEVSVNPFTGKIKARKVRMRLKPDLDSRIIKEIPKNDLVTVVGESGEFWAVEAPKNTKAFVFRSFVLDNVVEGNHVNVRLEPSLDAPIIAHLNAGDSIEDPTVSSVNPKWLEIAPPASTHFYIAKDYVEYAGGPEVKLKKEQRQNMAEQLLDGSVLACKVELKKEFDAIDFDRAVKGYHTVIDEFSEFTDLAEQAKEALASFQEEYLQKQLSHRDAEPAVHYAAEATPHKAEAITDKMKLWDPIEEALYLSWSNINDNKHLSDYYAEQKLASIEITGIVEPYTVPVKAKPGDFILRDQDLPVGYLYSTQVNLQSLVGTRVKLVAAPRPNNNFAFPAYYVLAVE